MTSGVVYCRDNEDVEDAVRIMEGKQIRRLPVLDEAMQMVGMVSLGDVSHALPRDITGEMAKAVAEPASRRAKSSGTAGLGSRASSSMVLTSASCDMAILHRWPVNPP